MKTTPVIFFAISLIGLVPFIVCQPSTSTPPVFNQFLQRLEKSVENSPEDILPCLMKDGVFENLKKTSDNFINLCIEYDAEVKKEYGRFSSVLALDRAIGHLFDLYRKSAKENKYMLSYLEILDPIGLNVYLNLINVDETSPNFINSVEEFQEMMHEQMLVHNDIQSSFDEFLLRLAPSIQGSSNRLSFTVKNNLIDNLKQTSAYFKVLCVSYDTIAMNEEVYSPITGLKDAIDDIFNQYKESAKENRNLLNEIECVDPIGLNIFLTKKNVKNSSPNFIKTVQEFRATKYPEVPIVAGSKYFLSDFLEFTQRIKKITDSPSSSNDLPFTLQIRLIANLWQTSEDFKLRCVENDAETKKQQRGAASPATALMKTIQYFFDQYKKSLKDKKNIKALEEVQSGDPIGLHVYLTTENVKSSSSAFMPSVEEFRTNMLERIRLLKSGKDDSMLESLKENRKMKLPKIPDIVRKEITSEYSPANHETMDYFIEIASKQLRNIKMYPVNTFHSIDNYKQHISSDTNDVQILYDGVIGAKDLGHAICISYKASTQKVHVYDSLMTEKLEASHKEIIRKLYPFSKGIVFEQPKFLQVKSQTCGIYAIMYATMLLMNADPSNVDFKLNTISGEETLYMRLHILNMFVKQKLFLIEGKQQSSSMFSKISGCISPKVKK